MSLPGQIATTVKTKSQTLATLAKAGIVRPSRPDRLLHTAVALARWGPTPAAAYTASAARYPDDIGIVDEAGHAHLPADPRAHERARQRAGATPGIGPGDGVAIMCRNHRGFIEAVVACSKLGANALFLNTAFSKPQLTDVLEREDPAALVYDQEFADLLGEADVDLKRYIAWHEADEESGDQRSRTWSRAATPRTSARRRSRARRRSSPPARPARRRAPAARSPSRWTRSPRCWTASRSRRARRR